MSATSGAGPSPSNGRSSMRPAYARRGYQYWRQRADGRVLVGGWRSRDPFGTMFAAGLASMILFQLVVNVGMVMGIMPITGIPLPFVTHGGASLVSMALGLGMLQSINIRQRRAEW